MKTFLRAFLPLLVIAAAAGVLRWQIATKPEIPVQKPKTAVPLVEVLRLSPVDRQLVVRTHGTIQALDTLPLAPEVGGRVVSISPQLADGAYCARGDLLLQIDPTDHELSLAAAEAKVEQARAALSLEEAAAAVAVQDWNSLQEAEPNPLVRREPQLAAARADLRSAEATRDRARRDLDRCLLRAPFDARIESSEVALGQVLAPGVAVAVLQPTAAAEVILPLALGDLSHLGIDLACRQADLPVSLEAEVGGSTVRRPARLVRALPSLDPASRMLLAVARIEDPFGLEGGQTPVGPGLFVRALIEGQLARGVFVLPRRAIQSGPRVFLAGADDRLRIQVVSVLQWGEEEALVDGGLSEGDRIILTTVPVVVEGMKLEVREASR